MKSTSFWSLFTASTAFELLIHNYVHLLFELMLERLLGNKNHRIQYLDI
jgi:hypothetical protein